MIRAVIFDLDGVLVHSERMKAQAYAIAVQRLRSLPQPDPDAIEAYKQTIGVAREEASRYIMEKLRLQKVLEKSMAEFGVAEPWQVLSSLRVTIYREMLADPKVIRDNTSSNVLEVLQFARNASCLTGLVTMSHRDEASHILEVLDLVKSFEVVLTADDVTRGKPDPEIYLLVARRLGVTPGECLTLEDSLNGVRSGLSAGVHVIALATEFTSKALHSSKEPGDIIIVDEPARLLETVRTKTAQIGLACGR